MTEIKMIYRKGNITYYNLGSQGKFEEITDTTSDLSKMKYKQADLSVNADDIVMVISEEYNLGDGVKIIYVGSKTDYPLLQAAVKRASDKYNVICEYEGGTFRIAFAGKPRSGKTEFIKAFAQTAEISLKHNNDNTQSNYTVYENIETGSFFYELSGINSENWENSVEKLGELINTKTIDTFIYCFGNSIAYYEYEFVKKIKQDYPQIKILSVRTQSIEIDADVMAQAISEETKNIEVIPILAKSVKTHNGPIEAYGVDEVYNFLISR